MYVLAINTLPFTCRDHETITILVPGASVNRGSNAKTHFVLPATLKPAKEHEIRVRRPE
jgi:hypothetical protein